MGKFGTSRNAKELNRRNKKDIRLRKRLQNNNDEASKSTFVNSSSLLGCQAPVTEENRLKDAVCSKKSRKVSLEP